MEHVFVFSAPLEPSTQSRSYRHGLSSSRIFTGLSGFRSSCALRSVVIDLSSRTEICFRACSFLLVSFSLVSSIRDSRHA
ncbi:hypothetical protein B0H12DRAFT_1144614, partial [Mycena haematopus]